MKVTNTRGDWIGLAYWKNCSYRVDYFSSPDHWNLGFDVVYRLIFYTCDTRLIEKFRIAFKKAFGLSDDHYEIEQAPSVGNSVYWRVYWDNTRVAVLEMAIIPRSLDYIHQLIEANKNKPIIS